MSGGHTIARAREAIAKGEFGVAADIAEKLLTKDPGDIDALEIRILAAVERGDDPLAEQALRSAIAIAPKRRWPYADLGRLLIRLDRKREAEEIARAALAADPRNADANVMLGTLLAERGLPHDAVQHFDRAIALVGPHPQLLTSLGHALLRQGRLAEARTPLEAAAKTDPEALEPCVYLAEVEERLGRFEQANSQLDRAGRLAAGRGEDVDLQRAVLLERMGDHDQALAVLDKREGLSGAAQLQRGRLLERLSRYAEAWSDWTGGKARLAERAGRQYAAEEAEQLANALGAFFSPAESATPASLRRDVPQPIFIVGFPRSGTTLTEQILASHSAISAGGELPFGAELHDYAVRLVGGDANFPVALARQADWPTKLRDLYLARAAEYGLLLNRSTWFTDKMPSNDFWLPLLRMAFPQSPVVLVRRHPLDVLISVMAHDMTHGFDCAYRLEDAACHLALTDRLIETYREAGVGPTYDLRYEDLVADQRGETERLTAAIGLPFEPAQLSFHEREMVSPTPSYAQVRQPLNDRSIGRWRNFEGELGPALPIVAEAMRRGGYAG